MTLSPTVSGPRTARRPRRRALVATALAVCAVASLASCSKTITIGSKSAAAASAGSSAGTTVQNAGNAALQLVDSTASQAGLTGSGGTVVGAAVQQTPPDWVQLSAVTSPPIKSAHLIDINQSTLYRFNTDTPNSSTSACNDACAQKWPPVTIKQGGNVYLAGVDRKQVSAIKRQDGQVQITVNGQPLYRFSGDTKPGDVNGQGIDGTWFAAGPTGAAAN